ncbi:MAG: antitoxin family protein [Planctomycetaceae bacterium]|nr:antitoxin family protein [Planctomycetaceae bacterium]
MSHIEAVFRQGVFVPLEAVDLREEQRIRLSIEPSDASNCWHWLRSLHELHESVVARRGVLPDSTAEIAADRQR